MRLTTKPLARESVEAEMDEQKTGRLIRENDKHTTIIIPGKL